MYGLIHRAARQMVLDRLGPEAWARVTLRADIHDDAMISARTYPDDLTQTLLEAIRHELDMPIDRFLEFFGVYWVSFAGSSSYGQLLALSGDSFADCLRNLDRLHSGIQLSLPDAVLPTFTVLEMGDGWLHVRYTSQRIGLEPFVRGLLHGLLTRFNQTGVVSILGPSELGVDFRIEYGQKPN